MLGSNFGSYEIWLETNPRGSAPHRDEVAPRPRQPELARSVRPEPSRFRCFRRLVNAANADFPIFRSSLHCLVAINTGIHVCPALEGDCRLFSSPPTVPWCPGFHKFSCCSFEQKETFIELQVPHSVLKLLFDLKKQKPIQG